MTDPDTTSDEADPQKKVAALHECQRRLADVQRLTHIAYWEDNFITNIATWTEEGCRIVGLPVTELSRSWDGFMELVHPDDRDFVRRERARGLRGETGYQVAFRLVRPTGEVRYIEKVVDVICDEAGCPVRGVGAVLDVSGRKRAEEAADRLEREFATLAEKSLQTIVIFQDQGIVYANPASFALFGYTAEELKAMPKEQFLAIVHPHDRPISDERARQRLTGEPVEPLVDLRIVRKDGQTRWIQAFNNAIEFGGRHAILSTSIDITERKLAEEALRESERKLAESQRIAHIGHWETDPNMERITASDETYRIFGLHPQEDLKSWAAWERLVHPDDRAPRAVAIALALREGTRFEAEYRVIRPNGDVRFVHSQGEVTRDRSGQAQGAFGIVQDVTDWKRSEEARREAELHLKRVEEQFRQSQKMEAVGQLAGGVAHDFNNLLTIISGCSEILEQKLLPDNEQRILVSAIRDAGARASSLTRQLLAFSRKSVLQPRVLDLNAVLSDSLKMLGRLVGEDIDIGTRLDPALGRVKVDPGQFDQAVLNLAVNARDAMPHGGKFTFETANVELDEAYCSENSSVKPGRYVMVAVTDTGTGMSKETRARIFDPFFTTKEPGKGTGLGLSMVFGFVKQSGGHIAVYSEPARGTTFKLYFPQVAEEARPSLSRPGIKLLPQGNETILLVEDEDGVRALASHVLQTCGYSVLSTANAMEAMRVAERNTRPIHLLLTDVVMPGLGGRELSERLTGSRPGIKTVFMSGYTDDAVVRHGILEAETHFLQKPYSPTALAQKVREVLDG